MRPTPLALTESEAAEARVWLCREKRPDRACEWPARGAGMGWRWRGGCPQKRAREMREWGRNSVRRAMPLVLTESEAAQTRVWLSV